MEQIKFSIIMPAYNAEQYIGEAIQSIINQIYTNWELVIVDDGSTDKTLEIITQYAEDDQRIIAVKQQHSGTAAAARNTALNYVTGEYTQMLDADDWLSEDCLQKYCDVYEIAESKPDIISPIAYSADDHKNVLREIAHASEFVGQTISGTEGFVKSLDWQVHGIVCTRTDLLKQVKYDPELVNGDEFTTRKLFHNANQVAFCDACYYYRDNQESTTKKKKNQIRMYECLITDENIYNYSIENNMAEDIVTMCANKYAKSILAHMSQFVREEEEYTEQDKKFAKDIIDRCYKDLYDDAIWHISFPYTLIYRKKRTDGSLGKWVNIYNFMRRLKNGK